jgi:uncharacterized cupin superfamily protein
MALFAGRAMTQTASIREQDLLPAPIEPHWVIAGQPRARAADLGRSPDGTCMWFQWDCTAGTFHWYFGVEETVHILQGDVRVRDASGRESHLRAGDVAVMPANAWMVWHVDDYVRKLALCRYPVPRPFGGLLRRLQTLRNRFNSRQPPVAAPMGS